LAAKKSGPSPVEVALKNAYATIAPLPGIPRQDAGNKTTFFVGDTPYASVELDADTLRFRIRKPADVSGLEPMLRFYEESVDGGDTWLLFSMPASNKPGPAIEAGLGRFAGTSLRLLRVAQGA
jgi:hypothetical protein